ncbi:MAG TPA: hypothetical protein VFD32_07255, partial [Dehalococcoidia bacterium]|nr:hypothetical protein [Dehalococcoidia bacterium]
MLRHQVKPLSRPSLTRPGATTLLAAALAVHFIALLVAWHFPPALNSDSAEGFRIWHSWRHGAPWNHAVMPDPGNIARDTSVFQAWWSPGQYLLAGPFEWLGLTLGQAIAVGGFVAAVSALLGFERLFRSLGFDPVTAAWAVLALACNWTLTRTYGDYLGGEPALLAVLPWLILLTRRALAAGAAAWLLLPAAFWIGSMAKNSYLPMAAGLIAGFRGARLEWSRPFAAGTLAEGLRWLGWLGLGYLLFWATYLRLGYNPTSAAAPVAWWLAAGTLGGFPATSIFSAGTALGRVFLHPTHPLIADLRWHPVALVLAGLGGLALECGIIRREWSARPVYARLLVGVFAAYTGFFALLLLLQRVPGWEERWFKPAGFLLLPGLIAAIRTARPRFAAWLLGLAVAASCAYGLGALANRARYLHGLHNVGRSGITQHVIAPDALAVLHQLDDTLPPGALVVVPSPEIALELRRVRVMSTDAAMRLPALIAAWHEAGRASDLVVLAN